MVESFCVFGCYWDCEHKGKASKPYIPKEEKPPKKHKTPKPVEIKRNVEEEGTFSFES